MPTATAGSETTSLAGFLQILRLRKWLVALIIAIVVVTTIAVTACSTLTKNRFTFSSVNRTVSEGSSSV